jgi:hypothetical protein
LDPCSGPHTKVGWTVARPANEILEDYELEWAPRLRAVSLAAELQLDPKRVRTAAKCLGLMQRHQPHKISRYPASIVVALSGVGALEYDAGNYWSAVWELAGVRGDANIQQEWGQHFRRAISRFGCPTFSHLPRVNVGPILMHAGVPRLCLGELVDLVLRRADADATLDGQAFVQWATAQGRESRLHVLDKPVQYFLREGGEFAIDWVDRLIDLLDRLREPAPDLDGVRLPGWVVEQVQSHVADKALRGRRRAAASSSSRSGESARLALDPYGLGVHLVLPPVGDQPDGTAVWHVTIDGSVQVIRSRAAWPGASQTVPGTTVVVPRPVRGASASLGRSSLVAEIDVVDPEDPLLVFGDDGRRLPATLPLPAEPVWLLYPGVETGGMRYEGELGDSVSALVPYGWDGWRLERVDLQAVTRLRYGSGTWRGVRGASRARLELPKPVVGVTTAYALPVYAEPPMLVLPATEGAVTGWSVIVRRPGQAPLSTGSVEVKEATRLDVFQDVPQPWVGPYQIIVRGPLGRGLSREFEVVQGLTVKADPPWREFDRRGLVPCRVAVNAASQVHLSPTNAWLASNIAGMHLQASGSGVTEVLQLVPPHMAADLSGGPASGRWSTGPLRLESEALGEIEHLVVRVPAELSSADVVLVRGLDDLQRTSTSCRGGLARVELRRFTDTLAAVSSARLEMELLGRRIPLAAVSPRRLATGVEIDPDGSLLLKDAALVEGLQAAVYLVYQPWREPIVLPVDSGRTAPCTRLIRGGRLLVHLRVEDPWLPTEWPQWPGRENTFRCDQEAELSDSSGEAEISAWLLGQQEPPTSPEAVAGLFTVYGLNDQLVGAGVSVHVRAGVATSLSRVPAEALQAVLTTAADSPVVTAAVVHAGLPLVRLQRRTPEPSLWTRSPLAAVLVASPALAQNETGVREELRRIAGPVVDVLLAGDDDPCPAAARFGPSEAQLAALPSEVLDQVWRAANVVPTHLLDADSRITSARQLFEARTRPGLRRVSSTAKDFSRAVQSRLERHGHASLAASVAARESAQGWQSLPTFSIAAALAARLAARGSDDWHDLVAPVTETWATLARHAPSLVELDIVLAECLVLGATT